ncbi:MAG: class I SAM-dependent methyltransferase [Acidobacteriota bacterium]
MQVLKRASSLTRFPWVYRLWQTPFVEAKLEPLRRNQDLGKIRRVLDVGCGPGTNAPLFREADYLGLDLDPGYVDTARRRHGRDFIVADVRTYTAPEDERFDCILLNSLLHHIDDHGVDHILRQLSRQLTPDGHIHILDLVLPSAPGLSRWLALSDRGDHPRPLTEWHHLFSAVFDEVIFEPYRVSLLGVPLWHMAYFKGTLKSVEP